jgi:hypothetical protein
MKTASDQIGSGGRLARGEDLARGNHNMAAQPIPVEIHIHFGIERAGQIPLNDHAAKVWLTILPD